MFKIDYLIALIFFALAYNVLADDIITGPNPRNKAKSSVLDNFDYEIKAPSNWTIDNIRGGTGNLGRILYPKDPSPYSVNAIIHVSVIEKTDKNSMEFQSIINQDISLIDAVSPYMQLHNDEHFKIKNKKAVCKKFIDDSLEIYFAKIYLDREDIIIIFTLSAYDKQVFNSSIEDFKKTATSFKSKQKSNSRFNKQFINKEKQKVFEELCTGYQKGSVSGLKEFLKGWADKYKSVSQSDISVMPEYMRHAYDIFSNVIDLRNLGTDFENTWRLFFYDNIKYLIIQNDLNVIVNTKDGKKETYRITNFKPEINIQGINVIQYNEDFRDILRAFIGRQSTIINKIQLQFPDWIEKETTKRKNYLSTHINIYESKWGGFYIYPQPYVESIEFNEDFSMAIVKYKIAYLRETAVFEFIDGKWNYNTYPSEWIE